MVELKSAALKLDRFKYPLIVLIIGVALMLLPTGSDRRSETPEPDERMAVMLSSTEGVGAAKVLISESGVVVVCGGANDAEVRLNIIRAISSYTGFGSDKITILKMTQ